jgi:hypothetical protein
MKDENGDLLADSNNILNRWKNYFSQLLNVYNVSDVRQIEVHTAEPLVPGLSCREVEIATAKLKKYKSPASDQIPAELIQTGGEILLSEIHKLINSVWIVLSLCLTLGVVKFFHTIIITSSFIYISVCVCVCVCVCVTHKMEPS